MSPGDGPGPVPGVLGAAVQPGGQLGDLDLGQGGVLCKKQNKNIRMVIRFLILDHRICSI